MNANELADELESTNNWMKDEGNWKNSTRVYSRVPFEAATMLRTQQAEIEALKKKIQNMALDLLSAHAQADDHWVELERLRKAQEK